MNNLSEKLKEMEQAEFPPRLHQQIMKAIYWRRVRPFVLGFSSLFLANFAVLGFSLWSKLVENDIFLVLQAVLEGFELSFDFLSSLLQSMADVFPTKHFLMFTANLAVAGLVAYFFLEFRPKYNLLIKGR